MENQKILSWDVGIKNLAYCLMEKKDEDFKILKWGLINLVDDRQKCQYQLRTGCSCQEMAKFCVYHKDKIKLFDEFADGIANVCSKHKEKMVPIVEEIDIKPKKKNEKQILKKCLLCNENALYNLSGTEYCWCAEHYKKKGESFVKKIATKKIVFTSCGKHPMQELSEKLYTKLDKEFDTLAEINKVLIENQPSLRNPTMKTIASLLYGYFIIRGIIDRKTTKNIISEVRFVCPSNKLSINELTTTKFVNKTNDKTINYKMTKKLGIKYCKALVNESDNKFLDNYKKKDDLCDAFLQGFQYLFKPVPLKFFNKLKPIGFDETKPKKKSKKEEIDIEEEIEDSDK